MRRRALALAALALLLAASPARAQRASLETLLGLEGWKTDDSSRLLARDSGNAAFEARLHVWGALAIGRRIQLLALGLAEAGNAEPKHARVDYELLAARISLAHGLSVEGGKILMPVGLFGARRFAHTNPVIGSPDMYPPQYPWGVNAQYTVGALDFRAAAVSLPLVNEHYTPHPSGYLRPLIGAGVRLGPSLHIGAAATRGPYLGRDQDPFMPAGSRWQDFKQTVVAGDLHFSLGYVDTRAEVAWSSYEAPTAAKDITGLGAYVESRVTVSPRVFLAARLEYNDYAFILPISPFFWVANSTLERNAEVGAGYRISASWLAKASLRLDSWPLAEPPGVPLPDGYALAVQLSWHAWPLERLMRY